MNIGQLLKQIGRKAQICLLQAPILLLLLLLNLTVSSIAQSQVYTIKFSSPSGNPISGVQIFGNYGISHFANLFTDSKGEWKLDISSLELLSSIVTAKKVGITYSHVGLGLRFEPPEIFPTSIDCPQNICHVKAIADGHPSTVITGTVSAPPTSRSYGIAIQDFGVSVPGSLNPSLKTTDKEGYAFFAVSRQNSPCSDLDQDLTNNNYLFLPTAPKNYDCIYKKESTLRVCAQTGNSFQAKIIANCLVVPDLPLSNSSYYTIVVQSDDGKPIQGVKFFGNQRLSSSITEANRTSKIDGTFSFKTSDIGAAADDLIRVVPTGDYQFNPAVMDLKPNSCANNICRLIAIPNGQKAGVLEINVTSQQLPLGATRLEGRELYNPAQADIQLSDKTGLGIFPVLRQSSCNNSNSSTLDDFTTVNPSYPGCSNFSHNSSTPFEFCPGLSFERAYGDYSATCGESQAIERFKISGKVLDEEGLNLPNASLILNSFCPRDRNLA
jgi:hypothetical protein